MCISYILTAMFAGPIFLFVIATILVGFVCVWHGKESDENEEFTNYSSWWSWPNYYYRAYWPYYRRSYSYPSYHPFRSFRRRRHRLPYRRNHNTFFW